MSEDIVNLIENNPITKFNGNYQSKLIEKVKNNFTNYEQQLFLSSFYCYLKYDDKNDFVIDLDNVWKWLGFNQKVKAKVLLENHFIVNKDYKFLLSHKGKQDNKTHGGHNKEIIMLNIDTFKKFCLKAGTKKADEVHEYFIKLENILFEITKEECEELKQQLQQIETQKNNELQQLEIQKNKELEIKLQQQKQLDREKVLLKQYGNIGPIVYIIKVKNFDNGQYIIKIGQSRKGIQNRYNEHKNNYENILLLDCFSVDKCKEFETFLHNHEKIRCNRVTDLQGHEKEYELFLIGNNLTYQIVLDIINNNIQKFNYNINQLLLENELLHQQLQSSNKVYQDETIKELLNLVKNLNSKIDNLEKQNKEILEKINPTPTTKVTTGFSQPLTTLGPRLQQINPETLQLVKVFETVSEAMNENSTIKRPSIMKAIEENTIYCGFRWLLVDRQLDPNIINHIEPTKLTKLQNIGYIAKLNADKTEIVNVYLDRKTASQINGYSSIYTLENAVKNETLTNNNYYMLYENCDNLLVSQFEEKYGKPLLYKSGVGQYDLQHNLIREFACKYDCIKSVKMSDKTLAKALDKQIPYNNHYYKMLGSKLKWL
jgi:hypothetical protein